MHLDRLPYENGLSRHVADYFREADINIAAGGWDVNFPDNFSGDDPTGVNERMAKASIRMEAEYLANAVRVLKADTKWMEWHERLWV